MIRSLMIAGLAGSLSMMAGAAQAKMNDSDRSFLTQDVQGGRYEKALAELGATKAGKPAIRRYAQMVAHDHEQANAALMKLVKSEGVDAPAGMTAKDEAMLTKIKGMSGSDFDRAFVDEMNRINAEDKQAADQEKGSTGEQAIKSYLARFAAIDAKHKKMAADLRSAVS